MPPAIHSLYNQGIVSDLDVYFARFVATFSECADDNVWLGALLVSYFTHQGHTCIDLSTQAETNFPPLAASGISTLRYPTLTTWISSLQNCNAVGRPSDYTPLVLDKYRLYLYRYWNYEQQLVANLRTRLHQPPPKVDWGWLQDGLARLFPDPANGVLKNAAQTALRHHFCVISGGPGTGKAMTLIKMIALLLEQNPQLNIALVAPSAKMARQLQNILTEMTPLLNCVPAIKAALPQEVYTLQGLLGNSDASAVFSSFRHPLPYDVVVVVEASRLDLAWMTRLALAIPLEARWILLGDIDQVGDKEAGTVLRDIGRMMMTQEETNRTSLPRSESFVFLPDNDGFGIHNGLRQLATAVKYGRSEQALQILKSDQYPEVSWHHLRIFEALPSSLTDLLVTKFVAYFAAEKPENILSQLSKFGLLCVLRHGPYGVESINRQIEQKLSSRNLLPTSYHHHYSGRPLLMTRQDETLKLDRGERGMILRHPAHSQELQAFFLSPDGAVRILWPPRLPEHETAYAMTIYNSQGQQFDEVFLLLPDPISPLLTRELIYTAITRAHHRLSIWGTEAVFKAAISQQITRMSGL